ncbi:MAG: sulfur oxidation c-type cytochrome SoxX [Burkholderiaceae bacterium]|jgi:sulfur-oxidizing protein SoxX|nr:sulfur oxidation c-type cytochrome SoxX [Burkholderiaceae bacterium]
MTRKIVLGLGAIVVLASCAGLATGPSHEETLKVVKGSFKDHGIAKVDRLDQTELQRVCSDSGLTGKALSKDVRERVEKQQMATIKYPADGKFLGDFKEGEKVAQSGRGMQWSDDEKTVNGGNCYACHELSPQEISFGNIGPSLKGYGKLRGYNDATIKYTWGKIWNTHAYNACSQMPRFGDAGILTEKQLKDVMALLLDPNSPVNK